MYRQAKAVWHMIDCIWPMSYRCTCSKRVGCHGETRDNTLVYSALSFLDVETMTDCSLQECPPAHSPAGSGTWEPAWWVLLCLWLSGPLLRLFLPSFRIRIARPSGD